MSILDWILVGCGILILAVGIPFMIINDKKKRLEAEKNKQNKPNDEEENDE